MGEKNKHLGDKIKSLVGEDARRKETKQQDEEKGMKEDRKQEKP